MSRGKLRNDCSSPKGWAPLQLLSTPSHTTPQLHMDTLLILAHHHATTVYILYFLNGIFRHMSMHICIYYILLHMFLLLLPKNMIQSVLATLDCWCDCVSVSVALQWSGVLFTVYNYYMLHVPGMSFGFTANLTRFN